ncbi:hypothetical protein [Acidimangrovimonas pyrenivorans]|uniref:Peptidase inhibitor I78 family protein n=1 Tax=Acidimangrovimonas pyrenivorans TaxID=2030798 RepID=A0ABV7AC76_9RHOB
MHRLLILGMVALAGCGGATVARNETGAEAVPASPASCGAGQFQDMIGKHEANLQVMTLPPMVRIYQQGSPLREAPDPERLNFVFDNQRIIRAVNCG